MLRMNFEVWGSLARAAALVCAAAACDAPASTCDAKACSLPSPGEAATTPQLPAAPSQAPAGDCAELAPAAGVVPLLDAAQAHLRRARVSFASDDYARARTCVDAALAREPGHAGAARLASLLLLNDHRFAEARDAARRLVAADPQDALSWGTLSDALLELGDLAGAIDAAQHMMDQKPNLPAYGRAAHLRWLQGDTDGAKRLYELAIAVGSAQRDREPRAWMISEAARLFWHEGDYRGAAAGFELALREQADYAPALEGRGRAALALADYPGAIHWLELALRARPLAETAWLLGDAYTLTGDKERAKLAYDRVEREGAQHDPRTLALFLASQPRDPERALRLARAEYTARQDLYASDALALALHRAGRHAEADRHATRALAHGTPDARLLYHAGLIKRAIGQDEKARELIAEALRRNPRFDPVLLERDGVAMAGAAAPDRPEPQQVAARPK
jgi:tetratricopeptide (TPR) repeat protein